MAIKSLPSVIPKEIYVLLLLKISPHALKVSLIDGKTKLFLTTTEITNQTINSEKIPKE